MVDLHVPTPYDAQRWSEDDGGAGQYLVHITAPDDEDQEAIAPCPALVSETGCVRVAYRLNDLDIAALKAGGLLWFVAWGPPPVHQLVVTPR